MGGQGEAHLVIGKARPVPREWEDAFDIWSSQQEVL